MKNKPNNTNKSQSLSKRIQSLLVMIGVTLFSLTLINSNSNTAKAASSSVSFSTEESDITMGDEFTVTMVVSANLNIGSIELYINYDDSIIEFQSGGSKITGGMGLLRVSDNEFDEDSATKKYVMTFKAIDSGVCDLNMSEGPLIYDLDNGAAMSISSNSLSVNVNSSKTLSNNNNLKSLKVSPGTLDPIFDANVDEYKMKVLAETKSIVVSALPEEETAKVAVKGAKELTEGENEIVITVKAQSGEKKEYQITVTRESDALPSPSPSLEPSPSTTPAQDPEYQPQIKGFKVVEEDGNIFLENSYRYQLADVEDESLIPAGYVKTKLILYGVTIGAYTLANDYESDFLLLYLLNQEGEPGFYQYDREEKTLQRYNGKVIQTPTESTDTKVFTANTYQERVNQLAIIIAVLSAIIALLTIALIRFLLKQKGLKDDDID